MSEDYFLPRQTAQWNQTRGAWETGQHDLLSMRSELYLETWPASGMTQGGLAYELPTPELPTVGIGSSSSLIPTPRASDGAHGGPNQRGSKGDLTTASAMARLLPTPVASEGTKATTRQGSAQKSQTGQVWLTNIAHDLAVLNGESTNPQSDGGSK